MASEEHEVVIFGIGGRFPDSRGLREFEQKLFASSKLIHPDPARCSAGPSHSLDCSWTSAAQGLEIAASQVARGEVEAAIVASCSLVAFNAIDYEYKNMNFLSEDGECRPFDAQAEGFACSEITVCLFLQNSSQAKRLYCSLVTMQTIFLGDRVNGYLNLDGQLNQFLEKFYEEMSITPDQVAYVEATGSSILYCKQTPRIVVTGTEGNTQLIDSCKTASAINENAAFSWNNDCAI